MPGRLPASFRERDFSRGKFSRLQLFRYVQASELACLPDRSYRYRFPRRAAEAFTSEQNVRRYLRTHRTCYPADYRQLPERGLSPRKIRSLVSCSRATPKFTVGVIAATGGIFLFYMIDLVMGFFGHHVSLLYSNGPWGIAISVFIVIVAALNLILDFDFVETGVYEGAAKYMEWYSAFGIMVTLVWMYIEILHLLSQVRSERAHAN